MLRFAGSLLILLFFGACSSLPAVYSEKDRNVKDPEGEAPSFEKLGIDPAPNRPSSSPAENQAVYLVFIHGVGDTFPGYALNPASGWLNNQTAERIGLEKPGGGDLDSPTLCPPHIIPHSVFMPRIDDKLAYVQYTVRDFRFSRSHNALHAIEITWSPLTQWIKTKFLGYDSPSAFPIKNETTTQGCPQTPTPTADSTTLNPPTRVLLNRSLKEVVMDRNLADAIIYSGPYGKVIERGVAEALCHALSKSIKDDEKCTWPDMSKNPGKFLFMTHSLGSRIIYDTLLDLEGNTRPKNPFKCDEQQQAKKTADYILTNTPALYMMANQISLMGLKNLGDDAVSDDGPIPKIMAQTQGQPETCMGKETHVLHFLKAEKTSPADIFSTRELTNIRDQIFRYTRHPVLPMNIIAFNDPNDLLTWHLPSWYGNPDNNDHDTRPARVSFTNVFVKNAPHWIPAIFENPADAHSGYLVKPQVWDIIHCGASRTSVGVCE